MKFLLVVAALLCPLAAFSAPVINEFVAENQHGLTDSDGANSDWIEIYNPDSTPADLSGWHLTDDASALGKWTFPSGTTIAPGGFLVVFASGKDRAVAGQELHTNFSLGASGDYLGLVQPGGTVTSQFSPLFPPQKDGFSYGVSQAPQVSNLIASSVPSFLVPASAGALATDWNQATMASTAGWQNGSGLLGAGYETAAAPATSNVAQQGTPSQTSTLSTFTANLAVDANYTNFSHTQSADQSPSWLLTFTTDRQFARVKIFNRTSCCGSRLRDITIKVLNSSNAVVYASPLLNPENTGYAYPSGPSSLEIDLVALTGTPVTGRTIRIERTVDPDLSGTGGQGNNDEASVLSMAEVEVQALTNPGANSGYYTPLISTNVKPQMYPASSSAFLRYAFTVADPANFPFLKLRIRYDDGFIAYLNGVKIAERNAPAAPAWNSAATGGDRDDQAATVYEEIDVTAFRSALVAGNNVLAIQGLTSAAGDPDFLIQPQLIATRIIAQPLASYLRKPTPGAVNDSTWFYDFVADTSFSVKRGFYTTAQNCILSTPTSGASIYYTTNGAEPSPTSGTLYTAPIPIAQTTVLRARAFKANWEPTNVDTQTYLFLNDVIGQQPTGAVPPGWPASSTQQAMDYGMDQNVRALYGDAGMIAALQQIPSISIVTEQANLTNQQTGIYMNAAGRGEDWERPASIEWLDPSKAAGFQGEFQHNCGLRIRGGASRSSTIVKHSFRVYFRDTYSVPKLNYPIFGDAGTSEHDCIDLASSQNYSWPRDTSGLDTMVRDPFARETLRATGSPACRNRYFHLYLNGLYWGLYYFDERPVAGYGAAYFGGNKEDYDAIKTGNHVADFLTEATEGYLDTLPNGGVAAWRDLWNKHRAFATATGVTQAGNPDLAAYFAMLGRDATGARNPNLPVLVDIDSLIDYMLVIFYSGDGDAPLSSFLADNKANNWFALKNRNNPDMGFVFFNHDAEHTFGATSSRIDRTGPFNGTNQTNFAYSNPQWIFQDLAFSPEFRLRVADRAQKHFFNGGPMTTAVAQARMDAMAAQINLAVKAHSQRWGDRLKTPAFNATDWQNAVNAARSWLNGRENTVVQQLKNYRLTTSYTVGTAPLFPATAAPNFSLPPGSVAGGSSLAISAAAGTIYYTTNGTDPRAVGGAVAGTAYTGPIVITQAITTVKARARNGSEWSPLREGTYFADVVPANSSNLAISEINYHPAPPSSTETAAGYVDSDEFEFLEFMNISSSAVNLTGCYFADGIEFTAPNAVIPPAGRFVIARNSAAFQTRYHSVPDGIYAQKLGNSGDHLWLKQPGGATIRDFSYGVSSPWPAEPDGNGPSLVLRAPQTNPNHADPLQWRASAAVTPRGTDGSSYAAWKASNGVSDDLADDDHDGLGAFLEYAVGGALNADSNHLLPAATRSGSNLILTVRRNLVADDVTPAIQFSQNLIDWQVITPPVTSRQTSGGIETLTYTFPISTPLPRYYRARFLAQ